MIEKENMKNKIDNRIELYSSIVKQQNIDFLITSH